MPPTFQPDKLRAARKAKGFNQRDLAQLVGTDLVTISRWELGKSSPRGASVDKLAEVLQTEPDWFYSKEDASPQKEPAPEHVLITSIAERAAGILREEIEELRTELAEVRQALTSLQRLASGSRPLANDAGPNIEDTDLHGNSMAEMLAEADRLHREQGRQLRAARTGKELPNKPGARKPLELDDEGYPKQ